MIANMVSSSILQTPGPQRGDIVRQLGNEVRKYKQQLGTWDPSPSNF